MMMRYTKVTPEGDYIPPPPANSKASYATMLFVRADIVKNSGGVLSKAVTIATRYAAVRRQTAPGAGEYHGACAEHAALLVCYRCCSFCWVGHHALLFVVVRSLYIRAALHEQYCSYSTSAILKTRARKPVVADGVVTDCCA